MEHTLNIDSNRLPSGRPGNSRKQTNKTSGPMVDGNQMEIFNYVPADEVVDDISTDISLQPLNFDNQFELSQARDFLGMLEIERPDWKVFIPMSDSDEERVFVTEFLTLNGELVGLVAIEMTSPVDAPGTRAAVMSCLLNLKAIQIHLDAIQEFISNHLSHLSKRQGWKDLQLGSISSFSSLHEFQQF